MNAVTMTLGVTLLALLAPILGTVLRRWVAIPLVVFEIALGIAAGPDGLGVLDDPASVELLSQLGLAMLFFVAGSEIQPDTIAGRPVRRATVAWLLSLAIGTAVGLALAGEATAGIVIGIALSSTALGTILPILRDAGELDTPFGRSVTAIGAVGEFGPLLAISVLLSGRSPVTASAVLLGFAVVAGVAIAYAARGDHQRLHRLVGATLHTSGQFAVRLVMALLLGLVALSVALDIDMLLGAFAAGIVWRLLMQEAPEADRRLAMAKVDGLAFGFLVPAFFIYTGLTFDLAALLADPVALALVPVMAGALLVVRGLPGLLVAPEDATRADRRAIVLFGATALPIIVAVTQIGVDEDMLRPLTAAILVGAGMLSVLLFPALGLGGRMRERMRQMPSMLGDG